MRDSQKPHVQAEAPAFAATSCDAPQTSPSAARHRVNARLKRSRPSWQSRLRSRAPAASLRGDGGGREGSDWGCDVAIGLIYTPIVRVCMHASGADIYIPTQSLDGGWRVSGMRRAGGMASTWKPGEGDW